MASSLGTTTRHFPKPENNLLATRERCWRYIPLVKALLRGDWETAKRFFDQDPGALTARINEYMQTALHIAVGTGNKAIHLTEKLVELMPRETLVLTDDNGLTALHTAAWIGNTRAAAVIVQKHSSLVYVRDSRDLLPIHQAAVNARRDTLLYLLTVTKDDPVSLPFSNQSGAKIIIYVIASNFYDIALNLVEQYPGLATLGIPGGGCALARIARKVSAFPSGSHLNFWQRVLYSYVPVKLENNSIKGHNTGDLENPVDISQITHVQKDKWAQFRGKNSAISGRTVGQKLKATLWKVLELSVPQTKHIREQKLIHLQALQLVKILCEKITVLNDLDASYRVAQAGIVTAVLVGIPEVIEEIVDWFPNLIWARDSEHCNLFQQAVLRRHENVFNLIYQMSDHKHFATDFRDKFGNTMLHLAGRLAPRYKLNLIPGAALQMQRELQWFKEVEKFVNPDLLECQNKDGETPAMMFTREHKDLVVEGEKWMKDTANSCTIVAVLIVTVVFAAAIIVPGGNNGENGLPIFSKHKAFIVFAFSNAIALFTSTTSLLVFLFILTSRYAQADFLHILPKRLIIGLATLFLSILTMMVAFSSALYLVFGHNKGWVIIPVVALACLPITSFVTLQFPRLVDLISSTYGPGIFGKRSDRPLY